MHVFGRTFWVIMFVLAQVIYTIKESIKKANHLYNQMEQILR